MNNNKNEENWLTNVLFIIYLAVLLWILVFKLGVRFSYMESRNFNLIPFSELLNLNGKVDFGQVILNVLIFLPLGIYIGMLFKRWTFSKRVLLFFGVSLAIEAFQFIFRIGAFDVTDILTNMFGGIFGSLLFTTIVKVLNDEFKAQKRVNIIAVIVTIVVIFFLLLLKLNMLPVRYQ